MSMQVGGGDNDEGGSVMVDMNTTPLIDVMLVLLIIFILNVPIQTHAVKLDLPTNQPPKDTLIDPVVNTVEIDFLNGIFWNKQPVTIDQLKRYYAEIGGMPKETQPELRLRPDARAKYEVVDQVMAAAQQGGVTKMGFVGNEQYSVQ